MYDAYAKIRDNQGLSDYEVAKLGGFSRSVLTSWKNGKSSPSIKIRHKIAQVLGIPTTYQFTDNQNNQSIKKIDNAWTVETGMRVLTYAIKLSDGNLIELTPEQKDELQKAVDAFIKYYVENNFKKL